MTHTRAWLAVVALLAASAGPVWASCPDPPPTSPLQPGEIGIFFDPEGRDRCESVPLFVPFSVYVVVGVPEEGLQGMLLPDGLLPADTVVLTGASSYGAPGYDVIQVADACKILVLQDGASCPPQPTYTLTVATFQVMRTSGASSWCPAGFVCSSFIGPVQQEMRSVPCDAVWEEIDPYADGTPLVPASPFCLYFEGGVSELIHRWGPLKGLYRRQP